jgi:mannose-6-phosphate isomerase-like protein (cupin superfamily)
MEKIGTTYKVSSIGNINEPGRVTLNEKLALTGSEISVNKLPAGVSIPFVHSHKRNEEIYIVLEGAGKFYIDGDEFEVEAGNVIRIDPAAERCIKADQQNPITYICIQTEANSLVQYTQNDGVPSDSKPGWL